MPVDTGSGSIVQDAESGLLFELHDEHIGVLTLNRPSRMNAIDWKLYRALAAAIERVRDRDDIRVLVLRGAGPAFCAGGDIGFMRQMFDGEIDKQVVQDTALRLLNGILSLPQPTISLVTGPAIGLGATIALACDLIFASDNATFADPHVQMGLVPGDGGIVLWPLLLGAPRAKEYLLTGDRLPANDAHEMGMINHVLPLGDVEGAAFALAERLSHGPIETIRATKALTNHVVRDLVERVVRGSLAYELVSQESEYHKHAVSQFLDGSKVQF